jgi:hypothetical protein
MVYEQIERLLRLRPFQAFDILLCDQRTIRVKNLDFVSVLGDHRTVAVYTLPDEAEVIDLDLVVSLKFREPDLMVDVKSADP